MKKPRMLASFFSAEEGSALMLIGLAIFVLVGTAGLALDTGRAQLVQSKLSSSLDAAGLAGGATISTVNLTTEVNKYLNANFQNYLGATITNVSVTTNASGSTINLSATATLPTTLMRVLGDSTVTVSASSEIVRESTGLELAMVLDNTGSMSGSSLTSLKTAANSLVDILFGGNESVDNLWVGLVPFSQAVNVGSSHTSWLDGHSFNWGPTSWGGCMDARLSGGDVTDTPPSGSANLFRAYYWPDDSNNDWIRSNGRYRTLTSTLGPNASCSEAITPMTSSRTTILNGIAAMTAEGYTHVNLGAVWGWRLVSPRWRGYWGGAMNTNNLPLDYNTPQMSKAVIIMTDGENTLNNSVRTAYGYPSEGKLGTTSLTAGVTVLNNRLTQVCTSMKNNNILVYTIAFNNPGTTIQNLLRSCATQPEYYFNSPTGAQLQDAFQQIGDSLASLRVSH